MRILIFLFVINFSVSVHAATYASCTALDYDNEKKISLKLTWNKVFLNENNQGLEEWLIEKYTKEEIVVFKILPQEVYKCLFACTVNGVKLDSVKKKEKKYNDLLSKTPFGKKITINVDRISGMLIENIDHYGLYIKNDVAETPYTAMNSYNNEYNCEISNKTKF